MPPGVVDAFKSTSIIILYSLFLIFLLDLIRHGRHHHRNTAPVNSRDLRQQPPQNTHTPAAAAQIIVEEERKERSTMPTYKGLEHFKLEDKMGECVFYYLSMVKVSMI